MKKKFWVQICAEGSKIGPETRFFLGHFLNFVSLVFLEIAYNYSLQQCITSSRDKNPQNKFLGPNLGQNGPKLSLILGFQPFFQVWFISFPLNFVQ